jgi:hypothetical protein
MRRLTISFLILLTSGLSALQNSSDPMLPKPSLSPQELPSFIESISKYPIPLKEGDQIINIVNSQKNPCCTISNKGWTLKASHVLNDKEVTGVQQIVTSPQNFSPQSKSKIMWNKVTHILKKTSEVGPSNTKEGLIPGYNVAETYFLDDKIVEVTATVYNASFSQDKKNQVLEGSFIEKDGTWIKK